MDFSVLTEKCDLLSLFRFFPIHMAIKDRNSDRYIYHSTDMSWGGYSYEEFHNMAPEEKKLLWIQPDRKQQLTRYNQWLQSGSRSPLRITFKIRAKNGEIRLLQTHFEHIPDEEEPDRFLLEFSWDITEVIDNCLKDKSLVADVDKKVLRERNKLRAENGLLRIALEKLRDPECLAEFVKTAQNLEPNELPACLNAFFPDLMQIDNSAAGWAAAREIEEVQRLEDSLVDIQATALPAITIEIERIMDVLRSQLLMLRVQRDDGTDLGKYLQ